MGIFPVGPSRSTISGTKCGGASALLAPPPATSPPAAPPPPPPNAPGTAPAPVEAPGPAPAAPGPAAPGPAPVPPPVFWRFTERSVSSSEAADTDLRFILAWTVLSALSSLTALLCAFCSCARIFCTVTSSVALVLRSSLAVFTAAWTSPFFCARHTLAVARCWWRTLCVASASGFRVVKGQPSSEQWSTTPDSCRALWWEARALRARKLLSHPGYLHTKGRSSV
mmetsp:Transcript_26211/g.42035  ORF Transcript_26211/g.42035 Transcript_26211/m.42035 type:complete len:225 (-) Transcript_26211:368-1042(-)